MNEASVSSPFMKLLRTALPGAIVVKHHDASMIGLPDCSVTWNRKIAWLEFKLIVPSRYKRVDPAAIMAASPTQHQLMCNYSRQAHVAFYVMWVKKSRKIIVVDPLDNQDWRVFETTPQVVEFITQCLRSR
jgi:hypothetical protein